MRPISTNIISSVIRQNAYVFYGKPEDYDALADLVEGVDIVLLGEATHGTKEFYHERAVITKRLITQYGFNAIAIEGDWPDAYRINQYVSRTAGFN